jgi:hypothetical protein
MLAQIEKKNIIAPNCGGSMLCNNIRARVFMLGAQKFTRMRKIKIKMEYFVTIVPLFLEMFLQNFLKTRIFLVTFGL